MSSTLTTLDALMKELYPNKVVQSSVHQANPWLSLIPKNTKRGGDQIIVPVHYGNSNRRSAAFSTVASTLSGASKSVRFAVTRQQDYALAVIDREAIKASEMNEGAFVRTLKFEVDDALMALRRSIGMQVYRNSGGSVARVGSNGAASTTVVLKNSGEADNFEVGELIAVASTDGTSGSLRDSGQTAAITGVDREGNSLTFGTALATTISGAVANDYIFKAGDFGSMPEGLAGWITTSNPSVGESFQRIDRSVDPIRLSGLKVDASSNNGPVEEVLIEACSKLGKLGAKPDIFLVPFSKLEELSKSAQAQMRFKSSSVESKAGVGFAAIEVQTPAGTVKVIPDHNCPDDRSYLLTTNTWELASLGEVPHVFDDDGKMIRQATSDTYEIRIGAYYATTCSNPGANAVIKWA